MSLERVLRKVKEDDRVRAWLDQNPHQQDRLTGLVHKNMEQYGTLAGWADFNDKAGRVLGPLEAGLRYFSPLGSVGFGIYSAAKVLHYGLLKLPFAAYYAAKTGDWKGTAGLVLGEIAKYVVPFGTAADILPLNRAVVDRYLINRTVDDLVGKDVKVSRDLTDLGASVYDDDDGRKVKWTAPSAGYGLRVREDGDNAVIYIDRTRGKGPVAQVYTPHEVSISERIKKLYLASDLQAA